MKLSWIFFGLFTAFLWGLYYTSLEQILKRIDRGICIVFLCSLNVIFYSFFLKDFGKDILEIQTNSSLRGWLFLAFISSVIANYMAAMAIESSNATLAASLEITYPFWCMLFALIFFGTSISLTSIIGIVITFIGVSVIVMGQKPN